VERYNTSPKRLAGEGRQNERCLVNLLAVVLALLLLFLCRPSADRLLDIAAAVLAADHETDLAGRIGRNGSVCVLGNGEDLLARLLEVDDERHVQPLVLSYPSLVNIKKTPVRRMSGFKADAVHGEEGAYNLVW
jgi:hypothetical protein